MKSKLLVLFFFILLLVPIFTFTYTTVPVYAPDYQGPIRNLSGHTELDALPPKEPVETVLGDGTRIWNTRLGDYIFDKSKPYIFSYKDRFGELFVDKAQYWVNTTSILDPAKISGFSVIYENNTQFIYGYDVVYKGGLLSKDTIVGRLVVTWDFDDIKAPKQSISFIKSTLEWNQGVLGDFNIILDILPVQKYLSADEDITTQNIDNLSVPTKIKSGAKYVLIGSKLDFVSNRLSGEKALGVFWEDANITAVVWGGQDKVFGSKGLVIVFPKNISDIDPTLYEYYNSELDYTDGIWGANWTGQTFTTSLFPHTITSVKLYSRKAAGAVPGTVTVSIKAVSAGVPTGLDLVNMTMDGTGESPLTNGACCPGSEIRCRA